MSSTGNQHVPYGDQSWLVSARTKFARAVEHARELVTEVNAYLDRSPASIVATFDESRGHFVSSLKIDEPPPDRLAAIVGDVMGNLRASLDHMVWSMACQSNDPAFLWSEAAKKAGARRLGFPIAREPEHWHGMDTLRFLDSKAIDLLETFQPYRGTEIGDAVARLDDFNNIDKHRLIRSAVSVIELDGIRVRPTYSLLDAFGDELPAIERLGKLEIETVYEGEYVAKSGTELHHIRFENGPPAHIGEAWLAFDTPTTHVLFNAGGDAVDEGQFRSMLGHVGRIELEVSRLFDGQRVE